jgi:predicted dienelactone hydrolase
MIDKTLGASTVFRHAREAIRRHPSVRSPMRCRALLVAALAWLLGSASHAQSLNLGFTQLAQGDGGHTTVFYPTRAAEMQVTRGPFELSWAKDAAPARGHGRLIVISHGSGGSPWVHADLARELVSRGFVVALPQHHGDNHLDPSGPGPDSWVKRPREVSHAIDLMAAEPRFSAHLSLDAVGVFGGSAGGHTALSLAGGAWSPARFRDHCDRHLEIDFSSCVGFTTLLDGNWLDGIKTWLARRIIAWRFSDETLQRHTDPRVKAAVAMVPFAADFVPDSLAEPRVALGLVIASRDVNQIPALHVETIRTACEPRCEVLMALPDAGHGAMLSPMPPLEPGSVASRLLSDPPSFDRTATLPVLHSRIAEFFTRTLRPSQVGVWP